VRVCVDEKEEERDMGGRRTLPVIGGGMDIWTRLFFEREYEDVEGAE
jgi:hypothetical protein